jgi:hypothetical protein
MACGVPAKNLYSSFNSTRDGHWGNATEQLAGKCRLLPKIERKRTAAAKADFDFVGFMRELKPPTPSVLGFSAACEIVPSQFVPSPQAFPQRLKAGSS